MNQGIVMRWYTIIYFIILIFAIIFAYIADQVITVSTEGRVMQGRTVIVIDAGHGGVDGGATSCTGVLESQLNLEIALRLNDLMHLLGYNTCMIRTTDISVYTNGETIAQKKVSDLRERVRIIAHTDNALLLSIHQNQFSDSRYSGAQVFYANTPGSDILAKQLQSSFVCTINPGSRRLEKQATDIYLMEHIPCTGVLIECGFLSNPQEEAKLRSKQYQKNLCSVIASSVCVYLDHQAVS